MLSVALSVSLFLLSQVEPGPLDGFQANYMAIKVDLDYEFWGGEHIGPQQFARAKSQGVPALGDAVQLLNVGSWGCDGSTEYFLSRLPDKFLNAEREKPQGRRLYTTIMTEAIYDGSFFVCHHDEFFDELRRTPIGVATDDDHIPGRYSPFLWFLDYSFPKCLEIYAPEAKPQRRTAVRDDRRLVVEVYDGRDARSNVPHRVEVWYDPSIGCLPRFARSFATGKEVTTISEMNLIEARSCAAGGFVPTQWTRAVFVVRGLAKRYPRYDIDTVLEPTDDDGSICHFKATNLRDRSTPVALVKLEGVNRFDFRGRQIPLDPQSINRGLTMADAKRLMGRLSGQSSVTALPDLSETLDADEVRELQGFSRNDRRETWPDYVVIAITLVLVCYLAWWGRKRLKTGGALILVGTLIMHGCGDAEPVFRLSARFDEKVFLYKPLSGPVRASLEIRNDGNRTVQLSRVDGGCSCRKIDQSRLPASLAPGSSLVLSVGFMPQPGPPKQTFRLKFETDHGSLDALAPLFALPTHGIAPPSIAMTLDEDQEDAGFDLVHRAIFRGDAPEPRVELVVPPGLTAVKG